MQGKKYGLQLRVPKSQPQARPPIPKPAGFNDDDDDDVEREISRQASKKKSLKDVEEQHKKTLEEDPSAFDYDAVYDDMKAKVAQPRAQDRQQRQPKYIQVLMEKAKQREREHEIVYERKLAKERSQEDHLYADKDKFVTGAYKRKLAEQAKWMEEERLRQLREERDDVTKKSDITDFYFNLQKNVAFGGPEKTESKKKPQRPEKEPIVSSAILEKKPEKQPDAPATSGVERPSSSSPVAMTSRSEDKRQEEASTLPDKSPEPATTSALRAQTSSNENPPPGEQQQQQEAQDDRAKRDHHRKSEDALAAAKARFLARKKAKV